LIARRRVALSGGGSSRRNGRDAVGVRFLRLGAARQRQGEQSHTKGNQAAHKFFQEQRRQLGTGFGSPPERVASASIIVGGPDAFCGAPAV
jgi:hypothetical protein